MKLVNFTVYGSNKVVKAFEVNKEGYKRMKESDLIEKDVDGNKYLILPDEEYLQVTAMLLIISEEGKEVEPKISEIKKIGDDLKDDEMVKLYILSEDDEVLHTIEMQYGHIEGIKHKFKHSSRTKFSMKLDKDRADEAFKLIQMLKIVSEV